MLIFAAKCLYLRKNIKYMLYTFNSAWTAIICSIMTSAFSWQFATDFRVRRFFLQSNCSANFLSWFNSSSVLCFRLLSLFRGPDPCSKENVFLLQCSAVSRSPKSSAVWSLSVVGSNWALVCFLCFCAGCPISRTSSVSSSSPSYASLFVVDLLFIFRNIFSSFSKSSSSSQPMFWFIISLFLRASPPACWLPCYKNIKFHFQEMTASHNFLNTYRERYNACALIKIISEILTIKLKKSFQTDCVLSQMEIWII